MIQRAKATIKGMVQGIGFRPFVYQLAQKYDLHGFIANTSFGVELEIEGEPTRLANFFDALQNNHLPLAEITQIDQIHLPPAFYPDFSIRESQSQPEKSALIPPDVCVCAECLREMRDPTDRRYRYPFINCTNCGPRYTIILDIPYDRAATTMNSFQLCAACQAEYRDPANRRFHAQPNACPVCGPQVRLLNIAQEIVPGVDPIRETVALLRQGAIVAIKGLGGFHLAVDAENSQAVRALRQRKNREEKPLAIMAGDLAGIRRFARVSEMEQRLLQSPERPIVLLKKKQPNPIAPEVAPGNHSLGVFLPYTPLHHLMLENNFLALVLTSANLSEEPMVIDNQEAFERLGQIADYFLLHNREIYLRTDDSVLREMGGQKLLLRRSRGFVPRPIRLPRNLPPILACGAELKNTVCLTKSQNAFLSQHIGDLKHLESLRFFELTIGHLQRILDIQPEVIAHDLHPDYLSTKFALEQRVPRVGVQHHHAHILSCLTENQQEGPVIGLAFDGSGFGTDGKIWGSEVLLVDGAQFTRLAHLQYSPMPGGDAVIAEPWRMALSYLTSTFGADFRNLPLLQNVAALKIDLILAMIRQKVNCPETSSLGRLFDGVAALLGFCTRSTYEGQAAIALEMAAAAGTGGEYPFSWSTENGVHLILPAPVIAGIVQDLLEKTKVEIISQKFHATLIRLFTELIRQIRRETGLKRVAFSGGVFQNEILTLGLERHLRSAGFQVFRHSIVPPNDGGIALGQAAAAALKL
jgi:hydrogenase maturation protein HypF